jgi:RNA polymerase sigma-70 factor (ECF subfamily)
LEDGLLGAHYKKPLEDALRAAVARLTSRQRVILRLNLVGGLTTVRIAKMYTVNQATVSRWLANARTAVWSNVEAQLTRTLRLSASDVASLLRALAPNIDVSLGSALADATSGVRRSGDSSAKAVPSRSSSKSGPTDLS